MQITTDAQILQLYYKAKLNEYTQTSLSEKYIILKIMNNLTGKCLTARQLTINLQMSNNFDVINEPLYVELSIRVRERKCQDYVLRVELVSRFIFVTI